MFARVAVYDLPGNLADETVKSFNEAMEEIGEMEGLVDAYLLVGPEGDHAMTVTFWSTKESMERSRVRASRLRSDASQAVGGAVRSAEEYQVAVHQTRGSGLVA
jgi:heme-degrading monooxygenase HmoA